MKYPEHEKVHAVKAQSQQLGAFLEWAGTQHLVFCELEYGEYEPSKLTLDQLLAKYLEIDLVVLEAEKLAMIGELRAAHGG